MISQTAEYALRAMVLLAQQPEQTQTVDTIATQTKVPVGYLAKIMLILCKAGLVGSQRGIGGGFQPLHRPDQITVYDVLQAVDPIVRITECPLHLPEHGDLCPLHRALDSASGGVEAMFRATTLASLVGPEAGGICGCLLRHSGVRT